MNNIKYNTAAVLKSLANFYAERDIALVPGSSPKTDGNTIHLPELPRELNVEQLNTLRAYLDHEAAHIRYGSFSSHDSEKSYWTRPAKSFTHMEPYGKVGKIVHNALEDSRIEWEIEREFEGVGFRHMHDEFCENSFKPDSIHALIHMLYLNSRRGWGHHPDCSIWEMRLDSLRNKIEKSHLMELGEITDLAIEVCEILKEPQDTGDDGDSGDSDADTGDDDGDSGDSGGDSGEASDDTGDSGGDTGDSGGDTADSEGDADDSAGSGGDGGSEGEGEDSGTDNGTGGSGGGDEGDEPGDGESDGGSDPDTGNVGSSSGDNANSASDTGAGCSQANRTPTLDELNRKPHRYLNEVSKVLAKQLKPGKGEEGLSVEDVADVGGTSSFASGKCEADLCHRGEAHSAGHARGSILGRLLAAKVSAIDTSGFSPPRTSGQVVDRGSLARFANGVTDRVLCRVEDSESPNTDIVLCLDCSGSVSFPAYEAIANACGALDRGFCMAGASVGIVAFGEYIRVTKPLSRNAQRRCFYPMQEGNTDTGNAMLKAHEMLNGGSGRRKICVVLTDGMPGVIQHNFKGTGNPYIGSPCLTAMRRFHAAGTELIVMPFDTSVGVMDANLKKLQRHAKKGNEQCEAWVAGCLPFAKYLLDCGVFISDIKRSPRLIAKQVMEFRGDLGKYIR